MSQEWNEWELSKENVQPLRQGRIMSTLQEVLAQQETSSHAAIQQQKQEFESEIRFYSGDDPLDVWDRYIKWTEQTFPQGGKESNLSVVLERAVKALHEQQRYYKDPRYLNLWLKFGNYCSEPLDVYTYLHSQEIGTSLALFYVTWAEALEERGSYKKADLIFQEGLQRRAEPQDKLQSHHRQFQARVSRQTLLELEQHEEEELDFPVTTEPQRSSLAELKGRGKKKVRAPISRVGDALKAPNRGRSFQNSTSQQVSNGPNFAVFDENTASISGAELPICIPQPWAAPPIGRAKENELKAGPWNSGRRPRGNMNSGAEVPSMLPTFTPYVEESAQQVITPCKIEPSINHVLSARKPGREEDPLQRVQNHQQDAQEKKEMAMYCKERVYAGVEEFSLEEIRAEIYRKKEKKKREEEFQAIAQKKAEMQRRIEELKTKLKEKDGDDQQQKPSEQPTEDREPAKMELALVGVSEPLNTQGGVTFSSAVALTTESLVKKLPHLQSESQLAENAQQHEQPCSKERNPYLAVSSEIQGDHVFLDDEYDRDEQEVETRLKKKDAALPSLDPTKFFSIFDESSASENQNVSHPVGLPQKSARRPLAVRKPSDSVTAKENIPPEVCDELHGIEPLAEDAIVTGSYKNKTLCPSPEDTCDFVRAAHLASTPFHGVVAQRIQPPTDPENTLKEECPESKSTSLSQQIPVCEPIYNETLCIKKLSPIMEASQEDTHSSGSSVSSGSSLSSVTHISTIKYLHIPEKLELAQSLPVEVASDTGCTEDTTNDTPQVLWSSEHRRRLLHPLPDLLSNSPDFYLENGSMPVIELEKEIELGSEIYCIKQEYWTNEDYKMFFGVLSNYAQLDAKGFAIKVYSQPVPWDFYITLQLQERLSTDFDQSFSESCSCFLYPDGCAILHREINRFTLWDIIQRCKDITEEVIVLVVYNLLDVVEKLHKAEIVHGNLCPEAIFLGDRMCDPFANNEITSALKIVDFSHSLDLRLQPRVSLLNSFPVAQTQHGQQILAKHSLPYQVDLVGIADIVHLMLFGEHLQVYQEDSLWKISQNFFKTFDSDLWNKFFRRILNADGKSTVLMLRELREEMNGMFDSSFQECLCEALARMGETFNVENFL
uniref:BUB1 N-terminal domain-containing protein n=1 Tax=Pelusios castaneus TaxID=367368 RepID=A0A8C8RN64_9SAUR